MFSDLIERHSTVNYTNHHIGCSVHCGCKMIARWEPVGCVCGQLYRIM